MKSIEEQLSQIKLGVDTLVNEEELIAKLKLNRPLRIKFGVDPTRPDLTFGHLVVFNKLKTFQDLGHHAILLMGDYTATIGDPSGRSATRPVLTKEEVKANTRTYLDQAFKVLDRDRTEIRSNAEWFDKQNFSDAIVMARKMTVAQMLERDDFSKRFKSNTPISIVEFLYPLLQGHDSVELNADVELGGNDQLFNLLVGRDFQRIAGQSPQVVITMPLLVGLDGVNKMSKSLDNYIAFNDSPKDMFGKIMSISDATMWAYYQLLLMVTDAEIAQMKKEHPMAMKKQLAMRLVERFHDRAAAQHELEQFEKVFSKGQLPENMPTFSWKQIAGDVDQINLVDALGATQLFPSKNEIRRLIEQGAVKLNQEVCSDPKHTLGKPAHPVVIQAGKRLFCKIGDSH